MASFKRLVSNAKSAAGFLFIILLTASSGFSIAAFHPFATALKKPLILIEDNSENNLDVEELVIIAKEKFLSAEDAHKRFDPKNVNPTYEEDIKFRKLNE